MENKDVILTLELTIEDVNLVLAGLGKIPLESSVGTWAKIKQSAETQLKEQGIQIPAETEAE